MYLVDTNILIYYFNDSIPTSEKDKINNIFKSYFNISIITEMEFLGYKHHTKLSFEKAKTFISNADVLNINREIAKHVINIRKQYSIKLPDAIIASTSMKNNLTLVTRNVKDFSNLNCAIYNPFQQY